MGESGEDWLHFRENSKRNRMERQDIAYFDLTQYSVKNNVELEYIQAYQLRLRKGNTVIDIYPQRNKYHIIRAGNVRNKRGKYKELMDFVSRYYG
jgi:hypothetical protein